VKSIVFDVNETLLDLRGMRPRFEEAFGSSDLLEPTMGGLPPAGKVSVGVARELTCCTLRNASGGRWQNAMCPTR
jgi:hypothetical protein